MFQAPHFKMNSYSKVEGSTYSFKEDPKYNLSFSASRKMGQPCVFPSSYVLLYCKYNTAIYYTLPSAILKGTMKVASSFIT